MEHFDCGTLDHLVNQFKYLMDTEKVLIQLCLLVVIVLFHRRTMVMFTSGIQERIIGLRQYQLNVVHRVNRLSYSQDILAVPLDNRDIRLYSTQTGEKLSVQRRSHLRAVQCTSLMEYPNSSSYILASGSLDKEMHVGLINKFKGTTSSNKFNKSFDEPTGSPVGLLTSENNKNGNGPQQKKINRRTPLTEKPTNLVSSTDKKQQLNPLIDKQSQQSSTSTNK